MKSLFCLLVITLCLTACGTDGNPPVVDLAPAAMSNATTGVHLAAASQKIKDIVKNGAKPGDKAAQEAAQEVADAQQSQADTQQKLVVAQKEATDQGEEVAKLKKQHDEDQKAVTRRNYYLLLALFVGALVFYSGEWTKELSPYTILLPNVIAGMLSVMIFAVLSAVVITLWTSFGWIVHLF